MGNTELAAFYAMGAQSGNAGAGSQTGISAKIAATPTVEINIAASRMNDDVSYGASPVTAGTVSAAGAASAGTTGIPGLSATYYNATESILSANWQATPTLKLNVGYLTETQSNPSNGVADALVTANNGVPIVAAATNTSPYGTNLTTTMSWLGAKYDLSPVSRIMAGYYSKGVSSYTKTYSSAGAQQMSASNGYGSSTLFSSGNTQIFAAAFDYDLSKKTDVYVAANFQKFDSAGLNQQACQATTATQTNQPAACAATGVVNINNANTGTGALSQWGNLAGVSISYIGVGMRMKF